MVGVSAPRQPEGLLRLLAALRRWCQPVALGQEESRRLAGVVASDPAARRPDGVPAAVWVESEQEAADCAAEVACGLASRPDLVTQFGDRGVLIPLGRPVTGAAFVPPFVRERLRRARGLPAAPYVEERAGGWYWRGQLLAEELTPTALAAAAVAVVETDTGAALAESFGTPIVHEPADAAGLAADPMRAAKLSWQSRRRYVDSCDINWAAARVATLLVGPVMAAAQPLSYLRLRLAELNTPVTATVQSRVTAAVAGLPGVPT